AKQGDVVVVTINYRLGPFGFLNLASQGDEFAGSASNGIRDQILSLTWVRDNIADYGGDPGNVTIFGESAGGTAVLSILAAPSADGLYHRAIAHSAMGAGMPPHDPASQLVAKLGVKQGEIVDTLQAMSPEDLVALGVGGGPGIDGTVVTRSTSEAIIDRGAAGVPIIAGTNRDEGTLFTAASRDADGNQDGFTAGSKMLARNTLDGADPTAFLKALSTAYPEDNPRMIYEKIFRDMFRRACIAAAEKATAAGSGGWLYRFDLPATITMGERPLGATHAGEMAFTFNAFADPDSIAFVFHDGEDPVVKRLAEQWSNTIIAFARTGDPNGAGLPEWPRYSADDRRCLILDGDSRIKNDVDAAHRKLWGDS
ncbi:MAG: carboxylesterase family protein, partial [Desulfobacterales bacterium]